MALSVLSAANAFLDALIAFEPETYSGADCAAIVKGLAAVNKANGAAIARAAARAAACSAHRAEGYTDPDDWTSRQTGTSPRDAKRHRETTKKLKAMPATEDALRKGQISPEQAEEIANTEEAAPGSEAEMLGAAKRKSLGELRDRGRDRRQRAADPEELAARQRKARSFRHWLDELGMTCFRGKLTPEVGVPFISRLEAETKRLAKEANAADPGGEREPWECVAADAFAKIVNGEGKGSATTADVSFVVDLNAYRRGHAEGDEACHIIGGSRVTVAMVRQWIADYDPFIKAVIHDGVEIKMVSHFGRHMSAELRTALHLGTPPLFTGAVCNCEAECGRRRGLQWDHIDPVANNGPTSYENLQPLSPRDHKAKTTRDREAGLLQGKRRKNDGRSPP